MTKRRGKASKGKKGKEPPLNLSMSKKGVNKLAKKKKSRKTSETSTLKVAHSTSRSNLVNGPTCASVSTSNPLVNDQKKHEKTEGEKYPSGFIFMCNGKTKPECYQYRVFGLPKGKIEVVKNISPDTKLFLFDTDSKLLYGIYEATSKGALDLEPTAFNGQFQAQVKFKIFKDCLPLPESAFKHAIKDNYEGHRKFRQELSNTQVKSLISLFRPIAKKPSAKKSHVRPNVGIRPSFKSARTKEVVKSYPLEKPSSGAHYLPILETRPQHDVHHGHDVYHGHDVHHGQYDPFEPGLHVSHSQVQPRLLRIEAPPGHGEPYHPRHVEPYHPRHVEPYHPEQAHEGKYFPEESFRHPPESYASIRNNIETNNGDRRFVYGRQYHTSQFMLDRDVTHTDYIPPGYYSQRLSPTALRTAPLSQARNRSPSPHRQQNRLPSPHRPQNRLPSPHRPQNRLTSPHRSYHSAVASQDRGGVYAASLPQVTASNNLRYGESNLPSSSYYYSSATTRLNYR
ncbi:uncharacterized protein LOC120081120 [Benincasa hispida]|uniref:uncharacterized protein LOC120081120 n=1 Tax=Benincasa hispida TaxID=102211 RepID=UPI0019019BAF|nr:uncharacterized protein LOC120081120 [Benincasa hispida]XP_038891729.1 uncharacterized protein LOC120081120 [Benincasa hispida]